LIEPDSIRISFQAFPKNFENAPIRHADKENNE